MKAFQINGGSVMGRDHIASGRNNQDALYWKVREDMICAVVCDGCGSGLHSEVGAQIGARAIVDTLCGHDWMLFPSAENAEQEVQQCLRGMHSYVLSLIKNVTMQMITDYMAFPEALERFFLFTVVGAVVTPRYTFIFSLGDGMFAVNDQLTRLEPEEGNRPAYLAYGATNTSLKQTNPDLLQFKLHSLMPTEQVDSVIIGTDGLDYLLKGRTQYVPGRCDEYVGGLSQFWQPSMFENDDAIRRRLTVLNHTGQRIDWSQQQIQRHFGLLKDDTTIIAIKRDPAIPLSMFHLPTTPEWLERAAKLEEGHDVSAGNVW